VLWKARKAEEVAALCRDGLKQTRATHHGLFQVNLAMALATLGRADEAVAAADAAVNLSDDEHRFRTRAKVKVAVLRQVERYDQALAECQQLFKEYSRPEQIEDIRYEVSHIYSAARQFAKAEEQLRLILRDNPRHATACNDLGYILADQGKNLEEAEKLIRRAIELDREQKHVGTAVEPKDNAAYLDSLGWVRFRRGDLREAREWLEKAVALPDGNDPVVWDHLGDVCFRLEDAARARAAWARAAELYESEKRRKPDDRYKEIKHKLRVLETHTQQR
jgi:tetratricopeptide (TPR) repeat protein